MKSCDKCGTQYEGKVCPECGAKTKSSFGAILSLFGFLPHLTPKSVRERRINTLNLLTAWLFLIFAVISFFLFFVPLPAELFLGAGAYTEKFQTLFAIPSSAYSLEITSGYALSSLLITFLAVSFAVALTSLILAGKTANKKCAVLFRTLPYLFYLAELIAGISLYIGSTSVVVENSAESTTACTLAVLVFSAVFLALQLILDGTKLLFKYMKSYRYGEPGREKLFEKSAFVNAVSAEKTEKLRKILNLLPAILLTVFTLLFFILWFVPGSYFPRLLDAKNLLAETEALTDAQRQPYLESIRAAESLIPAATALIVFMAIFFAAAAANLVYRIVRHNPDTRPALTMLPFAVYVLYLFFALTIGLPQSNTAIFMLAAFLPGVIFLAASAVIEYAKRYLDRTYDYYNACSEEGIFSKNAKLFHFNVIGDTESVGNYALSDCPRLTSVILADSVKTIGMSAFETCGNLDRVILGNNVASIGNYAFLDCSSLEEILLPAGLKTIGDYAFANCLSLKRFIFSGTKDEWNAVQKGRRWDDGIGHYCVSCSDGEI